MIVLDTETTNLTVPDAAPLEQQPSIVEFAAIKLDDKTLKQVARMEFMCKPHTIIPPDSIAITGITNDMVKDKPPFAAYYMQLVDFFLGERVIVAHNLAFDLSCIKYELIRIGKLTAFPWPPQQICTVEKTVHILGHRMNLGALHLHLTKKEHTDAHRAMADVEALVRCVGALRKLKVI